MHTERQASELWCPMEHGKDDEETTCIGSGCAAWRWAEDHPALKSVRCADPNATTEPPRPAPYVPASWVFCPSGDDHACWVEPSAEAQARRRGYCGLAGVVQVFR